MKQLWKTFTTLNPIRAYRLLRKIHTFANYDKDIAGLKYAIQYGRLYFEQNTYLPNGQANLHERSIRIEHIINEYKQPTSYKAFLTALKKAQQGLIEYNAAGFVYHGTGRDVLTGQPIKNIETNHYNQAVDSLHTIIQITNAYPVLYWIAFRQQT